MNLTTRSKVDAFELKHGSLGIQADGDRVSAILDIAELFRFAKPNTLGSLSIKLLSYNIPAFNDVAVMSDAGFFKIEQMPKNLISFISRQLLLNLAGKGQCEVCGAEFIKAATGRPRRRCDVHADSRPENTRKTPKHEVDNADR